MHTQSGELVNELARLIQETPVTAGAEVMVRFDPMAHFSIERKGNVLVKARTLVELREKILALR